MMWRRSRRRRSPAAELPPKAGYTVGFALVTFFGCVVKPRAFFEIPVPKLPFLKEKAEVANKLYLITGSSDGIGLHTAKQLAGQKARVLLHGRDETKLEVAVWKINEYENFNDGLVADFQNLDNVRLMAQALADYPVLDGFVCNAATYCSGDAIRTTTDEGHEYTFGVNVLAPFLFASLVLPMCMRARKGRIVWSTDCEMNNNDASFNLLNDPQLKDKWTPKKAYSLSKLCNTMISMEMHERYGIGAKEGSRLTINCIDPGRVDTKLGLAGWGPVGMPLGFAKDTYDVLTDPDYDGLSGRYFQGRDESTAFPPEVLDPDARKELWDQLCELTGAEWPDADEPFPEEHVWPQGPERPGDPALR